MVPRLHHQSHFSSPCFREFFLLTFVILCTPSSDACGEPPKYGNMQLEGSPRPKYDVGESVKYACKPGYLRNFSSANTIFCGENGKWSHLSNKACSKKSCSRQQDPLNGRVNLLNGSYEFGSKIQFVCNDGYYLIGNKILQCVLTGSQVSWSDDPPMCQKVLCLPPPKISNGSYSPNKEEFEYNEVVTYRCDLSSGSDQFSLIGEERIFCIGNKVWSNNPPQCKVVKCPQPVVEDGTQKSGYRRKYSYKDTVMFGCNQGFFLHGSDTIVCESDSTWKPQVPKCQTSKPLDSPPTPLPPKLPTPSPWSPKPQPPTSIISVGSPPKEGLLDFGDLNAWIIVLIAMTLLELH